MLVQRTLFALRIHSLCSLVQHTAGACRLAESMMCSRAYGRRPRAARQCYLFKLVPAARGNQSLRAFCPCIRDHVESYERVRTNSGRRLVAASSGAGEPSERENEKQTRVIAAVK